MGDKHKCKLCSRTFTNGRALGGHMKHHFSTLPLPPKPEPQSSGHTSDYNSSSEEEEEEEHRETEEKSLIYGLRENPKKSFRVADPVFSFPADTGSVVQDRESETESKNPTRRRSKRNRKSNFEAKKPKLSLMESSPVSSVSETCWPHEEDVAMCLMMLSRDKWSKSNNVVEEQPLKELDLEENVELKKSAHGKYNCDKCGKTFGSSRALGSHKSICSSCVDKTFECPFCCKVFGSGQALGGHKRSHLIPSSSSTVVIHSTTTRFKDTFIDLNLPAPPEEEEEEEDLGVVSDA